MPAAARDMWLKLHAVFEEQTKQAKNVVKVEFFGFTLTPIDDVVAHIAQLIGMLISDKKRRLQRAVKQEKLSALMAATARVSSTIKKVIMKVDIINM